MQRSIVPALAACVLGISLVPASNTAAIPLPGGPSLRFEENLGQTDSSVRFRCRAPGYTLYLNDREAVFSFARAGLDTSMRLAFVDADPDVRIRGIDALPGRTNYLLGKDPRGWHTGVPSHGQVIYERLYPGIDALSYLGGHTLGELLAVEQRATAEALRREGRPNATSTPKRSSERSTS